MLNYQVYEVQNNAKGNEHLEKYVICKTSTAEISSIT
jgi:hypothetical protein